MRNVELCIGISDDVLPWERFSDVAPLGLNELLNQ